ncbi:MAG: ATP-dependent helicase HrpB, partial [Mailhella sp.]|nr:ATP-dependent helicase HrpB [Mailhella sp.]
PELRILAMSATMDAAPLCRLLDGPCVSAGGRLWPVDIRWFPCRCPALAADGRASGELLSHVARAVRKALAEEHGSILVFLPGQGEIRRVAELLNALPSGISVLPLYGELSPSEQDEALAPAPVGRRKVVLATSLAETSLTIEGIRVVIDAGLMRTAKFYPALGMDSLCTERVTQDAADQRAGRAGRTEPGVCFRLWDENEHLLPRRRPEILQADLAPFLLQTLSWGAQPSELHLLDMPSAAAVEEACQTLEMLGAVHRIHGSMHLTEHGRRLSELPLHPRLAHMMLNSGDNLQLASWIAALAEERPANRNRDIRTCLSHAYSQPRLRRAANRLYSLAGGKATLAPGLAEHEEASAGELLSLAWPERIAMQKSPGKFILASGRLAVIPEDDALARENWLAVAALGGGTQGSSVIWLAAPMDGSSVKKLHGNRITEKNIVCWDSREQAVLARSRLLLDHIVVEDIPLAASECPAGDVLRAVLKGVDELGLSCLPWTEELRQWQARVLLMRKHGGEAWPDISDSALSAAIRQAAGQPDYDVMECWLAPWLTHVTKKKPVCRHCP